MALSNKKIKYIKNTIGQKSIKELAIELQSTELEIEEVLKTISSEEKRQGTQQFQSRTMSSETIISEHSILIFFQAILIFLAPIQSKNSDWYDFANLAQGLYIQSISGFMVFLWLLDCFISKKFEIKRCNLYLPIFGILIWSSLSFLWATNISESLEILSLWVACAVIFFVLYNMIRNSFDLSIIIIAILSSMIYLIVIGHIQFFDPTFSYYCQVISPSGTFGNKNMFCDYLIIVLPICFYFYFNGSDKTRLPLQIFFGIIFGSGILLIIFSMTRAGMLTSPIILSLLLIFLIILKKKNPSFKEIFSTQKTTIALIIFGLFFIVLSSFILSSKKGFEASDFGKRIHSIFNLPEHDKLAFDKTITDDKLSPVSDSTTIRLITWANTIKMIKDKPLHGFGLYNWQIHYGEYRRSYYNDPTYMPGLMLAQLHNDYLQILADLGLIGFSLFAWLVICVFILFKRIFFSNETQLEDKLKALSLILCVVAFGIICNFSFLIVKSVPTMLLFCYFALIANIYYFTIASKKSSNSVFNFKPNISGWLLLPVLLISIGVTLIENNRGKADQLFKTAMDSHKQQKFDVVIETCENILARDPLHYKTHFVIANAYMSQDNFEKAAYHIEKGLLYYPNDLYALFQAGTIYIKQLKNILEKPNPDKNEIKKLEDKTLFWYGKAFAIREDFGKAWNNLGFLHERRAFRFYAENNKAEGDASLVLAKECFDKAIKQDPSYTDALLNKANILQNTGSGQEAIPIALKVLNISMKNLQEKENAFQALVDSKAQQNSGKFNDAYTQKIIASQEYLGSAPKAIMMLKIEYSKTKDYNAFLEVFEFEKKLLIQQLEIKNITYRTASRELELAKSDPTTMRTGISMDQLEKNNTVQKQTYEQGEIEYYQKMARLLVDMAEAYRSLAKIPESISTLEQVIELAKNSKSILDQESIARVQINALYLSTINKELISKFPTIQENFDKATYQGNPELNNFKKAWEQKFKEAKKMLNAE